ncbi:MAG: glycosyltransferase family 2 protein [Bacteroidales bacterium]|nr:glycosyltransferase family 2 protein [Bacteroidales bacterium]
MTKIAFVIPVFNRLKYTMECLEILNAQKLTQFFLKNEIIIIVSDDGSTDGTDQWIHLNYPDVIVLKGNGNLWYSGSLNLGIRYALDKLAADFIMVWENDIYPVNNYFDNLQPILEAWDHETIICSKLYYKVKPEVIFGIGGTFNPRTGFRSLIGRLETDGPQYNKIMEVDWFLGQGVLIHRDIIKKTGYFDEINFPQYHADIDYGLRAKRAGYHNIVYPNLQLLNDTETTGISHIKNKTIKQFIESLFSIKSNTNIVKDFKFNKIHTTSILAYYFIIKKYGIYTASFIKWKALGWFGIKRKQEDLF